MSRRTEIIPVQLADTTARIEVTMLGGDEQVAFQALPFVQVAQAIEQIALAIAEPLKKVKPQKARVEFGLAVSMEAGDLMALLVQGQGTANLNITLEWGEPSSE